MLSYEPKLRQMRTVRGLSAACAVVIILGLDAVVVVTVAVGSFGGDIVFDSVDVGICGAKVVEVGGVLALENLKG